MDPFSKIDRAISDLDQEQKTEYLWDVKKQHISFTKQNLQQAKNNLQDPNYGFMGIMGKFNKDYKDVWFNSFDNVRLPLNLIGTGIKGLFQDADKIGDMFIPTYKAEGQAVIQVGVSNLLSAGDKTIKGVIGNEDSSILYKNVIQGWNIANQGEKELLTFGLSAVGGKVVYSGVGSLGKVKNIIGTYLRHKSKTPTIVDIKKVPSNIINKPFDTIKAKGEGWKPPYPSDINIRKFKTNEEMKFLRVHVDKKKPTGRFLVRNKEVAHLLKKPEELRKHLGLPETPKYITEVKVPKGTEVITGRIGSQPKFGLKKESGIQYQLEKKLQEEHFTNTKSIEDFVTQNIKKK